MQSQCFPPALLTIALTWVGCSCYTVQYLQQVPTAALQAPVATASQKHVLLPPHLQPITVPVAPSVPVTQAGVVVQGGTKVFHPLPQHPFVFPAPAFIPAQPKPAPGTLPVIFPQRHPQAVLLPGYPTTSPVSGYPVVHPVFLLPKPGVITQVPGGVVYPRPVQVFPVLPNHTSPVNPVLEPVVKPVVGTVVPVPFPGSKFSFVVHHQTKLVQVQPQPQSEPQVKEVVLSPVVPVLPSPVLPAPTAPVAPVSPPPQKVVKPVPVMTLPQVRQVHVIREVVRPTYIIQKEPAKLSKLRKIKMLKGCSLLKKLKHAAGHLDGSYEIDNEYQPQVHFDHRSHDFTLGSHESSAGQTSDWTSLGSFPRRLTNK